jgi:hypothetical protein
MSEPATNSLEALMIQDRIKEEIGRGVPSLMQLISFPYASSYICCRTNTLAWYMSLEFSVLDKDAIPNNNFLASKFVRYAEDGR